MYTARNHARLRICGAFLLVPLLLNLSGCLSVGPDYARPTLNVPANWVEANSDLPGSSQDGLRMWWRSFNDPLLDRLVDQTLERNQDIGIALARLRQARSGFRPRQPLGQRLSAAGLERRGVPARRLLDKLAASRGRGLPVLMRAGSWISLVERAERLKRQMRALKRLRKIIAHCR